MCEEASPRKPSLTRIVASAVVTLGFLLLISRLFPPASQPISEETLAAHPLRQRVVIFLVDTSDYFDAHGTYVRSVMQRYCARCEVQQVNLHGDLSLPTIIQALQQVQNVSHTFHATTTVLVNLSLGTYIYDDILHTVVRRLAAEGVILIASAGNDNTSQPFYPAAFSEVLGICSSTRYTKAKAAYSNFGAWVGLCAPGLQYVTRPLRPGEIASGTSFASPMVAGVLGQLLLEAPCATPQAGRRALLRTADAVIGSPYQLGAGVINVARASQYVHRLYACQRPESAWQWGITHVRRLATSLGLSLSVIIYFFASIFTVPFLLAFVIEKIQRRADQRQQQIIRQVYAGSPTYRQQRLLALRQDVIRWRKVRHRDQAELFALLHALHLYGEPCWWCGKPAAEEMTDRVPKPLRAACSRCDLEWPELKTGPASDP
jgi:hypothetical protein